MSLVSEIDYGTPAIKSDKTVSLTIDGFMVTVPEGTSIMRAAMQAGIKVPKLCAYDMVDAFGSCRLCLVEIDRSAGHTSLLHDAGSRWHGGDDAKPALGEAPPQVSWSSTSLIIRSTA